MEILELFGYLAVFAMGVTLGVIGAGGSILTVPILVYFFAISPTLATAYSLALVGTTALIGGTRHAWHGSFDREAFLIFGLPSIVSVYLARRFFLPAIPEKLGTLGTFEITRDGLIMLLFSALMLAAAFLMIFGKTKNHSATGKNSKPNRLLASSEGLLVGGITGLVGAGGGFLIVPVMIWLLKLPIRVAVSTSLLVIAAKSLIGFIGDLQGPQIIDWLFLAKLLVLSSAGILAGVKLGKKIPATNLQRGFGWFILVTATAIIAGQFAS